MDLKLLGTTFVTLFLAELGDKTQLACMLLTAETRKPWTIFVGASLALVLVSLLGILLADMVGRVIDPTIIKKVAAVGFVLVGVLIFLDKL